jgi:hypothetical protein
MQSPCYVRMFEKLVKRGLNLQDSQCLTIFIYIIYPQTILVRSRLLEDTIIFFTMGTPYKIDSRTLILASSGEGSYHSNVPPRRHSGQWLRCGRYIILLNAKSLNLETWRLPTSALYVEGSPYFQGSLTTRITTATASA